MSEDGPHERLELVVAGAKDLGQFLNNLVAGIIVDEIFPQLSGDKDGGLGLLENDVDDPFSIDDRRRRLGIMGIGRDNHLAENGLGLEVMQMRGINEIVSY